jgi:hypothetical protein
MAKYYFDVADGNGVELDDMGCEFHDLKGAEQEAVRTIASLGREALRDKAKERLTITIRDENGPALEIAAALRIRSLREAVPKTKSAFFIGEHK